jgi:hypothetical protein
LILSAAYLDADQWTFTLVDIRTPPGFKKHTTTFSVMNFLRIVKENESPEVLILCSLLLFVSPVSDILPPPPLTWVGPSSRLKRELYSIQTPLGTPALYECLINDQGSSSLESISSSINALAQASPRPATHHENSSVSGPFTRARLEELLKLASAKDSEEKMTRVAKTSFERYRLWAVPWMSAYRLPLDAPPAAKTGQSLSAGGAAKADFETRIKGMEVDDFLGVDRFEAMAYL